MDTVTMLIEDRSECGGAFVVGTAAAFVGRTFELVEALTLEALMPEPVSVLDTDVAASSTVTSGDKIGVALLASSEDGDRPSSTTLAEISPTGKTEAICSSAAGQAEDV